MQYFRGYTGEQAKSIASSLGISVEPETVASTNAERQKSWRKRRAARKKRNIAVLDMETDPFDCNKPDELVLPFLAVIYSDEFETITIWEENYDLFCDTLYNAIIAIPDAFTIYAHNGGKFDFMFLLHKLRGDVSFKGRGIMSATIGAHELRDSYHIIPERLAAYKKDDFDYSQLTRAKRQNFRKTIIDYCINDCIYLLDLVKKFIDRYGFKISIGAASMAMLQKEYKFETLSPYQDERLRPFFAGGRVECIAGAGYFAGKRLRLYDVNSMYPYVMAKFKHPVGSQYIHRDGKPNAQTIFLKIECDNNGALLGHDANNELTSRIEHGIFYTTKWEYETALELGLIDNVRILECVDNMQFTTFERFVNPLYDQRALEKEHLQTLRKGTNEFYESTALVLFLKLILNNAYGKFAQNPRRFKEFHLTNPGEKPEDAAFHTDENGEPKPPDQTTNDYWIWSKQPDKLRFNNVGTAASITGGARAILMRAIHAAKNPLYCDTDSLICEELREHEIHKTKLGAWDIEKEISELIVCGKKLYAYKIAGTGEEIIRSKGASGLVWNDMLKLLEGEMILSTNRGVTLTKTGRQHYLKREIRKTAKTPMERQAL